ncbi:MAG: spore germination protein [Firmicutes bacterium]|nr:spore germination protein [Bacillota bacterium]
MMGVFFEILREAGVRRYGEGEEYCLKKEGYPASRWFF